MSKKTKTSSKLKFAFASHNSLAFVRRLQYPTATVGDESVDQHVTVSRSSSVDVLYRETAALGAANPPRFAELPLMTVFGCAAVEPGVTSSYLPTYLKVGKSTAIKLHGDIQDDNELMQFSKYRIPAKAPCVVASMFLHINAGLIPGHQLQDTFEQLADAEALRVGLLTSKKEEESLPASVDEGAADGMIHSEQESNQNTPTSFEPRPKQVTKKERQKISAQQKFAKKAAKKKAKKARGKLKGARRVA